MEEKHWKTSENNWKLMKTAGKTMKKQGTQPRTKKKIKKKCQLNSAPILISCDVFQSISRHWPMTSIAAQSVKQHAGKQIAEQ